MQGKLFVVSGPSGGGKTTLVQGLLASFPSVVRSVSVTTRPRRPSEHSGADYRFVSFETFRRLKARGELIEWARVHDAYYGTPKAPVERALARGLDVVLSLDVQGARQVRRKFGKQAVLIFVVPPSLNTLRARLVKRRTETPTAIRQRLHAAQREMACRHWYDYAVINRRIGEAVEQLKAIVMAERARVQSDTRR
ncbi:MAG: guanylate kinase [Candidatus Omnitrophica bacterium]|nr:guanylate kinase [Candidatus Omnitrophota bacterium]